MIGAEEIRAAMIAEVAEPDSIEWMRRNGVEPEAVLDHAEELADALVAGVATIAQMPVEQLPDGADAPTAGYSLIASAMVAQFVLGYRLGIVRRDSGESSQQIVI